MGHRGNTFVFVNKYKGIVVIMKDPKFGITFTPNMSNSNPTPHQNSASSSEKSIPSQHYNSVKITPNE